MYAAIPCLIFATATSFNQLVVGRLLMGIVGAGFVIGIRMTAEWFPPKEVGTAEGIYGGWGQLWLRVLCFYNGANRHGAELFARCVQPWYASGFQRARVLLLIARC